MHHRTNRRSSRPGSPGAAGSTVSFAAIDQAEWRVLVASLDGGVSSDRDVYLATYTFRTSRDARGTFRIAIRPDETVLLDSAGREIKARLESEATISVR